MKLLEQLFDPESLATSWPDPVVKKHSALPISGIDEFQDVGHFLRIAARAGGGPLRVIVDGVSVELHPDRALDWLRKIPSIVVVPGLDASVPALSQATTSLANDFGIPRRWASCSALVSFQGTTEPTRWETNPKEDIILQVSGKTCWRIAKRTNQSDAHQLIDLEAGHALFLPRGNSCAIAPQGPSLALGFRVGSPAVDDHLLQWLRGVLLSDSRLTRGSLGLCPGLIKFDFREAIDLGLQAIVRACNTSPEKVMDALRYSTRTGEDSWIGPFYQKSTSASLSVRQEEDQSFVMVIEQGSNGREEYPIPKAVVPLCHWLERKDQQRFSLQEVQSDLRYSFDQIAQALQDFVSAGLLVSPPPHT